MQVRQRARKHDLDALRAAIHGREHQALRYKPVGSAARTNGDLALEVLAYTEHIAHDRMKAAKEAHRLDRYIESQRSRERVLCREAQFERERRLEAIRPILETVRDPVARKKLEVEHTSANMDELNAVRSSISRAIYERERALQNAHDTRHADDLRTAILRLVLGTRGYSSREAAHIANLIRDLAARPGITLQIPSAGNVRSESTARRLLEQMREERRQAVRDAT